MSMLANEHKDMYNEAVCRHMYGINTHVACINKEAFTHKWDRNI